jgi:hypothetical protein
VLIRIGDVAIQQRGNGERCNSQRLLTPARHRENTTWLQPIQKGAPRFNGVQAVLPERMRSCAGRCPGVDQRFDQQSGMPPRMLFQEREFGGAAIGLIVPL